MKYDMMMRGFSMVFTGFLRDVCSRQEIAAVKKEYRAILDRFEGIGKNNPLVSSIALAAFFIALNRCGGSRTPDENIAIVESGMRRSKLLKAFMGDADSYFDEKRTEKRYEWSRATHERRYKNDWVVDVLGPCDEYDLGYDYTECGVCKLCASEGCPELAKYLCRLDFLLIELMGFGLERTTTLAEGGEKCDFRFHKNVQ